MIRFDSARVLRPVSGGLSPPRRRRQLRLSTGLELAYTYTLVVYGAAGYVTEYMHFQTNPNLQVLRPV